MGIELDSRAGVCIEATKLDAIDFTLLGVVFPYAMVLFDITSLFSLLKKAKLCRNFL